MKLFASSTLMWGRSFQEMARIANELELTGIELWAEQAWFHEMTIHDILKVKQEERLDLMCHAASWDLNMCSLNDGIRIQSVEEIIRSIHFAAQIGAPNVTVHPGRRTLTEEWGPWHLEVMNKSLDQIEAVATDYGVIVSLELMEEVKKELIIDAKKMNDLITSRTEAIQVTFDAAHVSLDKKVLELFLQLKRINKIHLSDSSESRYHLPLGEGEIELHSFLEKIQKKDVPVVLEGYDPNENVRMLQKHVRYLQNYIHKSLEVEV